MPKTCIAGVKTDKTFKSTENILQTFWYFKKNVHLSFLNFKFWSIFIKNSKLHFCLYSYLFYFCDEI